MIDQAMLLDLFEYRDGELYEKTDRASWKKKGSSVGWVTKYGYKMTEIHGKNYMVHRLIYLMIKGETPIAIDHINRNKLDNRIENLRAATKSNNSKNVSVRADNALGIKNVHWNKSRKTYVVCVSSNGRNVFHKYEKDLEAAELMAQLAREKYHKEFAYVNIND